MSGGILSSVVHALRFFSGETRAPSDAGRAERHPCAFAHREWMRHLGILDRTGLTLPFYARLLAAGDCGRFTPPMIAAFEQRQRDNKNRMDGMLRSFGQAVRALQQARVQFVCVKGFSLFPEFLDEPWERHQIDFDFLVAPGDGLRAQAALEKLDYKLTAVARDDERRLRIPASRALSHNAYLYQPQEGGVIEVHSRFWESGAEQFSLGWPGDEFEHVEMHTLGSVSFPRLSQPYAFLYQVLHVFRHFLGSWARPLWLYEIANYLDRHGADSVLWQRVYELISADAQLAEVTAFVLLTAQNLFACPIPSALRQVCALPGRSPIVLWVDRYARRWLLTDMPGNKLNLLLQRHFFSDDRAWRRYLAGRLAPGGNRPQLCEGIDPGKARSFGYRTANLRYQASRMWHHFQTDVGFAIASVAWELHLQSGHDVLPTMEPSRGEP